MKKLIFLVDAEAETAKAAEFYNKQQKDLGKRFICAVEEGAVRVRINPLSYPIVEGNVRRCLIRTFPFSIPFSRGEKTNCDRCSDAPASQAWLLERSSELVK